MKNFGDDSVIDVASRQDYMVRRRVKRMPDVQGIDYVPVTTVERSDDSGTRVLVVKDEVVVAEPESHRPRFAAIGKAYANVTHGVDGAANCRGYRIPEYAEVRESARKSDVPITPSYLAVVGGYIKGRPTPELTQQRPQPRTGEKTAARPLVVVVDTGVAEAAVDRQDSSGKKGRKRRDDKWFGRFELANGDSRHIDPLDVLRPEGLDLAAGHGTFVAGVIAQVSHAARIVMIRAMDTDGLGSDQLIARGIRHAGRIFNEQGGGRGVLNLSFGIETVDNSEPPALRAALNALPPEVIVVAAAGNEPAGRRFWPAASPRVLGVAALGTRTMDPTKWSNYGSWVDFSARGTKLVSPFVAGTETPGDANDPGNPFDPNPDTFEGPNPFAKWSGTSFAAAQVSGSLANLLTYDPDLLSAQAIQRLKTHGQYKEGYGYLLSIL